MKRWNNVLGGLLILQVALAVGLNLGREDYGAFEAGENLLSFEQGAVDSIRIDSDNNKAVTGQIAYSGEYYSSAVSIIYGSETFDDTPAFASDENDKTGILDFLLTASPSDKSPLTGERRRPSPIGQQVVIKRLSGCRSACRGPAGRLRWAQSRSCSCPRGAVRA